MIEDHLKYLNKKLNEKEISNGFLSGGMKQKELKESEEKQVMELFTASEGFDCKTLNTIFLASPKNNERQAVGENF